MRYGRNFKAGRKFETNKRYDRTDGDSSAFQRLSSRATSVPCWRRSRRVEVIVEQDHRTVAVIRTPHRSGRPISEILRQVKERNSTVTLDPDFGKDLAAVIASHQQPWNSPSWERSSSPPSVLALPRVFLVSRVASLRGFVYLEGMEVHFTPEQETQLSQIATHAGTDAERLVKDAALRLLQEENHFRAAVREGIA
jgi:hypothetical protein